MRPRSGQERAARWGLTGLRERAKLMGGHLDVCSEVESGTQVELTIPASIAYAASQPRRRCRLFANGTEVKS